MNFVLCGMPCAGKTTVGRCLSRLSGREFADTDAMIEEAHGNIPAIFDTYGEGYFRELEREAVRTLCKRDGLVISTGGGLVLFSENVALLRSTGRIIYLRAKLETLVKRGRGDRSRPLLRGDLAARLSAQLSARAATYEGVADQTVDTDGLTPEEIAKVILMGDRV